MKFSFVFLGVFAALHAALATPAGVAGIQSGDMTRRLYDSSTHVVRADDDAVKRNLGEHVETRQIEEAIDFIIEEAPQFLEAIFNLVESLSEDNDRRTQFTQSTVAQANQKWPAYNWVICHPDHTTAFDGTEGKDWGHAHYELPVTFGTIGYDLYGFTSGTFTSNGDGGFINWAYIGYNLVRQDLPTGHVITCSKRP